MCTYAQSTAQYAASIHLLFPSVLSLLSQNLDAATLIPRCMLEGRTLVVTDLATGKIAVDDVMMDVLACRRSLHRAKAKLKITVQYSNVCIP